MRKTTVRRGAIVSGIAGVAVLTALLAPAIANAAEPGVPAVAEADAPMVTEPGAPEVTVPDAAEVARPGMPIQVDPNLPYPSDPSETVLVTRDDEGHVTIQRGRPGQLPPGAVPAVPLEPGQHGVTVVPRDTIPALPAPSTGSAG
ncbi:hypothetical protein OHB26_05610 [Nocardia sp. NBC_01503]|uniref:hypothetical protein n=1 Tax=Nocardia sp. NBC_01503 TaxID=2975997 RepID=UPI002E7B0DDE|nr:hypothetical protein [Nocardia sp. NBC_01503]WTL33700.1 hypothetical protein OHB26_05610 [Nocardia sp. NBC_01503]